MQPSSNKGVAARISDVVSLLAPSSPENFIEAFVRKNRWFVKAPNPRRAESLLPRWMLDRLVASDVLPPERLLVMRNGVLVEPRQLRTDDGRLRHEAIETLTAEGVSFVINGIDDEVPGIAELCDSLERRIGHSTWVNAYATYGPGGALPPHYDDHDVLVVQVHGTKRWYGHGMPMSFPIERSPDGVEFGPPVWDVLVEPGDVLYVPRGEVHHTTVEGDLSVHLTFGIEPRRGIDLVSTVLEAAAREPLFREDVTRLGGRDAQLAKERRLKDRMHALVEELDLEALLTYDDADRELRHLPHLVSSIVTGESIVVPTPRRSHFVQRQVGDAFEVRLGGKALPLTETEAAVLAFLLEHDRSTLDVLVAALLDHDESAIRDAIVGLARAGLVGVEPTSALHAAAK
jgi:hypothetical protein